MLKVQVMVISLLITFFVGGCSTSFESQKLPLQNMPEFSIEGDAIMPQKWWTVFNDGELNDTIETALRDNFFLESIWQRLKAAEAIVSRESAAQRPVVDAMANIQHEGGDNRGAESELRLGLQAGYEVDLWKRIQSSVEAEVYRKQATHADYQTASLTLAAEIVEIWFELNEAHLQLDLLVEQLDTNRKVLHLLKARFANGQIQSTDVLRQRQLLEATQEQYTIVDAQVALLQHQLRILAGRPPQSDYTPKLTGLPALPPLPDTGLPSDLVQRRPDVQRAMLLVRAAGHDIAAAVKNRYPRLNLSASLFSVTNTPEQIIGDWIGGIAAELIGPVIDGKRRQSEVDRTKAVARQRLAEYGQTVLDAFVEVEDALAQEQRQKTRILSLKEQVRLAGQIYKRLRIEYFNGVSDYIEVLRALNSEQRLQRDLLAARRSLLTFRVALYRALAGGIPTERENEEKWESTGSEDHLK